MSQLDDILDGVHASGVYSAQIKELFLKLLPTPNEYDDPSVAAEVISDIGQKVEEL